MLRRIFIDLEGRYKEDFVVLITLFYISVYGGNNNHVR